MPPKRTPIAANQSPPPNSNANEYHHHSPIAGHLPDLPEDSAAASASPQSKRFKENDMPPIPTSPNQRSDASMHLPVATDLLTSHLPAAADGRSVLADSPIANRGTPILSVPIQSPIPSGQLPVATDPPAAHLAASAGPEAVVASSPIANGGARAAYAQAQQQRTITCNLSLIPPSKFTNCRYDIDNP